MVSGETSGPPEAVDGAGKRRRGRPARISRELIACAARELAPEALTMQAVADVLGVDPKALNYHVGDREGLRELVALDVFETELARVTLPVGRDWQAVVRSYAMALRDAVVRLGPLAASIRLPGANGVGTLRPVECVLRALVGAGFSTDDAGRGLTLITETAFSAGLSAVWSAKDPVHPDVPGVISVLQAAGEEEFPLLREVVAGGPTGDQLEFSLTVLLVGLEQLRSR